MLDAKSEWLFPSRHNAERPINWLRKAHIETLKRSAINPPFRLYDLRHTALTRMAMAGIDLPTLRELAGPANIQMTMRYVHPTPEHKRAAIQKLENFISDARDPENRLVASELERRWNQALQQVRQIETRIEQPLEVAGAGGLL